MAVLTAAVTLALLAPLFRTRSETSARDAEIAIYRDQLDEIGRDVARGVLAETEAKEARNEIARRLLKAGEESSAARPDNRSRRNMALLAGAIAVPLVSIGAYLAFGDPNAPDRPYDSRVAQGDPSDVYWVQAVVQTFLTGEGGVQDPAPVRALVDQALTINPEHPVLLETLAMVAVVQRAYDDVFSAYDRYLAATNADPAVAEQLGEVLARLLILSSGTAVGPTEQMAQRVLAVNPRNRTAQILVTLAMQERGQTAEAEAAWVAMIAEAPPGGADWVTLAQQQLAELRGEPPPAAPAPTAPPRDPAAIANMTPADQMAFMQQQIGQLAARLAASPRDAEGWAQLIRSYVVLGQMDDARAAVATARATFAGEPETIAQIDTGVVGVPLGVLHGAQGDVNTWAQLIRSYSVLGQAEQAGLALDAARTTFAGNAEALATLDAVAREME
jgi:cytochrome c-type biogenesis protein CcmH